MGKRHPFNFWNDVVDPFKKKIIRPLGTELKSVVVPIRKAGVNKVVQIIDNAPTGGGGGSSQQIPTATATAVPSFKTGGKVKKTGLAYLHKNEHVLPAGVKLTKAQEKAIEKKKKNL